MYVHTFHTAAPSYVHGRIGIVMATMVRLGKTSVTVVAVWLRMGMFVMAIVEAIGVGCRGVIGSGEMAHDAHGGGLRHGGGGLHRSRNNQCRPDIGVSHPHHGGDPHLTPPPTIYHHYPQHHPAPTPP